MTTDVIAVQVAQIASSVGPYLDDDAMTYHRSNQSLTKTQRLSAHTVDVCCGTEVGCSFELAGIFH